MAGPFVAPPIPVRPASNHPSRPMRSITTTVLAATTLAVHGIQPYSAGTVGTLNKTGTGISIHRSDISNPTQSNTISGIGDGAVGRNSSTTDGRLFWQVAAFRVSDLLAAIGSTNLADLGNFTFTYNGITEASTTLIPPENPYFAAYLGQWQGNSSATDDVPLRGASAQNMTDSGDGAADAQRTLFGTAIESLSGYATARPSQQLVNLNTTDLASTAQTLNATGFDLAGLATELAGDSDLTNNFVFFSFYLNPKLTTGGALTQCFTSVNLVPVENALRTVSAGTFEIAGPANTDWWGFGAGLAQEGGSLRFEYDATGPDKALVTGDFTHTGGTIAVNLTTRPPVGTPVPLIAYSGGMTGTPVISLEPGTRYTLASTSLGDGSDDAVSVTFGGAAASLFWTGANGAAWDVDTTENWVRLDDPNPEVPDHFFTADDVTFDDGTPTAPVLGFTPSLTTTVYPYSVKFSNTTPNDYTLGGTGGIGGSATFSHTGSGKVTLVNPNTHTGANSVSNAAGVLQLGDGTLAGTLGTGPLALTGELILNNPGVSVYPNNTTGSGTTAKITQQGSATVVTGSLAGTLSYNIGENHTLQVGNGGLTGGLDATSVTVSIPATSSLTFLRANASDVNIAGKLVGAGPVTFKGTGVSGQSAYALSGNTLVDFTGSYTIDAARLTVDNATDVSAATGITVLENGQIFVSASIAKPLTLQGDGWLESVGRLGALRLGATTFTGAITLAGNTRIGVLGATATISGAIGETGGARALELLNSSATNSSLTLGGPNAHSGGTTIRGLTCVANHSAALGNGPVTVNAHPNSPTAYSNLTFGTSAAAAVTTTNAVTANTGGSIFGFGGTSGTVIVDGGTLSPGPNVGTTIGTLATGNLDLKAQSTFKIDLNSPLATQKCDRVNAAGDVTIAPEAAATFKDQATSKATFAPGTKFVILDYTGHTLTGTFKDKPNGFQFTDGPNTYILNYADTTDEAGAPGNYVTIGIGSAYDAWAATKGLDGSPGKAAGFYDDPEMDGLDNGLEWILGGDPLVVATTPPVTTTTMPNGDLKLQFNRLEASIGQATLAVEYSATLATGSWTTVTIGATGGGIVAIDTAATPDAVTVTIPAANAVNGRIFARLKATMP